MRHCKAVDDGNGDCTALLCALFGRGCSGVLDCMSEVVTREPDVSVIMIECECSLQHHGSVK
jgi:hypothetical protein